MLPAPLTVIVRVAAMALIRDDQRGKDPGALSGVGMDDEEPVLHFERLRPAESLTDSERAIRTTERLMFPYPHHKGLALLVILLSTTLRIFGAIEDFSKIAKQTLAEIHAKHFQAGNIKECVSIYAGNAKFFVDHKLVASGEGELLAFYKGLREVDRILKIEVDEFLDIGSDGNLGWAIFNYRKDYDLKGRDPNFIKRHKLEGLSILTIKQYGTAIFAKIEGQWKIRTMTVFDPEIWEPRK